MAYQKLGLGSSANDGTGDDLRTGGDKINENFEDLFAKINGVANSAINNGTALTSDTVTLNTATQTLTNKTLTSPTIGTGATVTGAIGGNFTLVFEGATANDFETTIQATDPTADRTIVLPDAGGTVSLLTATETLTNKTLTAPKIADAGFIADANGAEQIIFQTTASAVNEIEITNAATGGAASAGTSTAPIIGASGETNVDLALLPKGTGHVAIRSTGGANNQGAIRLNCEQNTHGQTLMSQPHSASDSGFFMLPKASNAGNARTAPDVLLSGARTLGETETVSGDGAGKDAISLDTLVTLLNTSGGTSDLTLAAGTAGQVKIISMHTAGNAATLDTTDGNLGGVGSSIVFDAIGEGVVLLYTGAKWVVVGQYGVTIS
mgnify:CR=1 FL=1|tara:strand:- start:1126 stop:2265 length:1140 start_codon:yes stop_codon:yes gene_type:complete